MYNKERVKERLKNIRCIYKERDQFRQFYIYKGLYVGWPWSLTVVKTAGDWRYELLSLSAVLMNGESTTLSYKTVFGNKDGYYDKLISAIAVAAYEVIEDYDLWRKSYDFDYPAKNQ